MHLKRNMYPRDTIPTDIEETLEIGWKLLVYAAEIELKRIDDKFLDEYYGKVSHAQNQIWNAISGKMYRASALSEKRRIRAGMASDI